MDKQMIKIMKKMNKEFFSFADQYSNLREDTIKKVIVLEEISLGKQNKEIDKFSN